ncbi:non-specific lipid-transfer protein P5-like [Phalaenopsis equestris]|uniref:non-specific lipid-transfer protein P5-like n=1 Tax=Phalaenopsis equestris TaxID=78828 RepID=UPI0009E39461|nr:non-specific lipid-transfer protein P5-like [Phalaenopsis equestris]
MNLTQPFNPSMASATARGLVLALLAMTFIAISTVESAIPCSKVATKLINCVGYAQHGGQLPAACSGGAKELKAEAITAEDRRTVCSCIKLLAQQVGELNQSLLASIPGKCGVDIGCLISLSVDCSK